MAKKRGTSAFTHIDDAVAPIHTTNAEHSDSLHYGAEVPEAQGTVILGPGPFGSPDPRTLGHRMNPAEDRPASAPALDKNFTKMQGELSGQVVFVSEDQLNQMSKQDLIDLADRAGVEVNKSETKQEIIDTLLESDRVEEEDSDDETDEEDDTDDESDSSS